MIISRTPLRVSLFGGGSDIPSFFKKGIDGSVINFAIDKYVFVTVNKRFDNKIRISYSNVEIVSSVDEIRHTIIKECLLHIGIKSSIEITIISDFPGGTGMGSSSSLTVGVLNALYAFVGVSKTKAELAEEACGIELIRLEKPVGKQDQYAASFGGINHFIFSLNETKISSLVNKFVNFDYIIKNFYLVYTGITRDADDILLDVNLMSEKVYNSIVQQVKLCNSFLEKLDSNLIININEIAESLRISWEIKKEYSQLITNNHIEGMIENIMDSGALGLKILGAGGGGFILVIAENSKQFEFRMKNFSFYRFTINHTGSEIIFNG